MDGRRKLAEHGCAAPLSGWGSIARRRQSDRVGASPDRAETAAAAGMILSSKWAAAGMSLRLQSDHRAVPERSVCLFWESFSH
ncbi:hypothetical protein LCGC14_2201360 [marine sediment metagenome]|uniref:Uncharacterized protein n=1 Tax=marine sediment metagenome TaxID=412755 RepID=A0A0F9E3X0_9ZZZZ